MRYKRAFALRFCLAVAAFLCLTPACSHQKLNPWRRVAVVRFENLSGDARLDWIGPALSESLMFQLTGTQINPAAASTLRGAISSGKSEIVQGYFSGSGARLHVRAVIENNVTHRTEKEASADGGNVIELADSIAHQIEPAARGPATHSLAALQAFSEAIVKSDAARAPHVAPVVEERPTREVAGNDSPISAPGSRDFEKAIAADPDFAPVYLAWVEVLMAHGDVQQARQVLVQAAQHSGSFPAIERERLALAGAVMSGDRAGNLSALEALTRLTPADPSVFRQIAEIDVAAHAYPKAVAEYGQALERDPDDIVLLNQLGYTQSYARDLQGATATLERYRALRPQEPNPFDSLGDVYYYLGHFKEAAGYYAQAYGKDPAFLSGGELYKAAWANLMNGDAKSADDLFSKYIAAQQQQHDPLVVYRQAQWEFLTGHRKQALAKLADFAKTAQGGAADIAASQLAIWNLETGNPQAARAWGRESRIWRRACSNSACSVRAVWAGLPATRAGDLDGPRCKRISRATRGAGHRCQLRAPVK